MDKGKLNEALLEVEGLIRQYGDETPEEVLDLLDEINEELSVEKRIETTEDGNKYTI